MSSFEIAEKISKLLYRQIKSNFFNVFEEYAILYENTNMKTFVLCDNDSLLEVLKTVNLSLKEYDILYFEKYGMKHTKYNKSIHDVYHMWAPIEEAIYLYYLEINS